MEPIFFNPDFKERVWGGEKLATVLNKSIPFKHTGESWEVACHKNGQSIVRLGQYTGLTLEELLIQDGEKILGKPFVEGDKFPLLIKFIDAKEKLSVQVHPDDAYAWEHENGEYGKSEAWYVLQADPGSKLIAGLKSDVSKEAFTQMLNMNQLEEVLNEIEVKAGDVLDIPAGLIHAIGDGILLAEVQQNSDTTYRVYDWGRVGLDGNPRDLHIQSSIDVIDFTGKHSTELAKPLIHKFEGYTIKEFVRNPYFILDEIEVQDMFKSEGRGNYFEIFMCVDGAMHLTYMGGKLPVVKGDVFMIPAKLQEYYLKGHGKLVRTYVEEKA
jgi:mannose-6-phosphate isomerase